MAFLTVKGIRSPVTGKRLVYVNYVVTAPWNDSAFSSQPAYKLVGTNLLDGAILISRRMRMRGRIGLHSLVQSEEFYRRYGMIETGIDAETGLKYFESSELIA